MTGVCDEKTTLPSATVKSIAEMAAIDQAAPMIFAIGLARQ